MQYLLNIKRLLINHSHSVVRGLGVWGFGVMGLAAATRTPSSLTRGAVSVCVLVSITRLGFSDHSDRSGFVHEGSAVPVAHVADAPQMRVNAVDTRFEGSAHAHPPCTVSCCDIRFLFGFLFLEAFGWV